MFKLYSVELNMHLVKWVLLKENRNVRHLTETSDLHKTHQSLCMCEVYT